MSSRTNVKPQIILIRETIHKSKKFFNKSFTSLKSFTPKQQTKTPIFLSSNRINSKLQDLDDLCTTFSEKWDSVDVVKTKDGQLISSKLEQSSMANSEISGLNDLREEKKASKYSREKQKESNFLARKMKDLEMMDLNDMDHVQDVEEVLHYYSRITCPVYVEIVDKFFMDMYSEFHVPQPSKSVSSSMRSLGPLKL